MSTIFLTKNFSETGEKKYFAIDSHKIETLNLSDAYDQYGQEISHEDAGDYSIENSYSDAKAACEKAIEEKFQLEGALIQDGQISTFGNVDANDNDNYLEGDNVEDHNKTLDLIIEINEFIDEWRKENESFEKCKGFTYWNGHNWKTITTEVENGEPTHKVVTDENLIAELNKAIEEMEFEGEGFGCKIYKGNGFVIVDSFWQGTWAQYEIVPQDEYEMEQEKNSSVDYNY